MRVAIAGWFGSDNLGDEILLHTLMAAVRETREDASFVVLCPDPERVTELHRVDAVHMPTLRSRGTGERQEAAQRALREADILLLGPGTVFQERSPNLPWPGTLPLFARMVAMARLAGTRVAVAAAGVREDNTAAGRALLRWIGARCRAVGVRDQRSADTFGRGAQVVGDMAYTLRLPELGGIVRGQRFGLSLRPLASDAEASLIAASAEVVQRLRGDGWSGVFLPMAYGRGANGENDATIYDRAFRDTLDVATSPLDAEQPLAVNLDGWLTDLASYRLVLATRLHAALPAVALGVPTVAIAYERKVLDAFHDLGLGEFTVGKDVDADTLYRTATAAAAAPEVFREAAGRVAVQGTVARGYIASVFKDLG
ncbi:polysaccharide pyruvyl transferase family protein [Actinoplanes sp. NPDC051851]|uniref:polysaccharide pyruvyl transferase family protein n=1 Tax=Actinoplanes sp. NPDC051851 TaxID=3154753 RepID=UPI003441038C